MLTEDNVYDEIFKGENSFDAITNYSFPIIRIIDNKRILVSDDKIKVGDNKTRKKVTTIEELRSIFNEFIIKIIKKDFSTHPSGYLPPFLGEHEVQQLVNQLIFDVLFDMYTKENKMTANEYSKKMSSILSVPKATIYQEVKRGMEEFYKSISNNPAFEQQIEALNADVEKCHQYFTPKAKNNISKKKPKYIWDAFLYNKNVLTGRQYHRNLKRDSNYSYASFVNDLDEYGDTVKKILPKENDTPKFYFNKTMDYYFLECYKRVDSIFKITSILSKASEKMDGMSNLMMGSLVTALIERYVPYVISICEENDQLYNRESFKYFQPLLIIEVELFDKMVQKNNLQMDDYNYFNNALNSYRIIRAMAYETFNYHYEYVLSTSNNSKKSKNKSSFFSKDYLEYKEIKDFLIQFYNIQSYHETNEIWETIKTKKKEKNINEDIHFIETLKAFFRINDHLFPETSSQETKE